MTELTQLRKPYLLFLGDATKEVDAKTAAGIAYWRPDYCLGQIRLNDKTISLGLADMTAEEAAAAGAGTFVIGLAPLGGDLPDSWVTACVAALDAGLDIANGLHASVGGIPAIAAAAKRSGCQVINVRTPPMGLPCGSGLKRTGKRVLSVGSDCCVGKMYTTLAIDAELRKRGANSTFRATGQTGILIEGSGVAVDAVISDFLSGAVEVLTPDNEPEHWDVIEGQGSLFHPAYAGVSLGLLHGAQADALVMCHELGRTTIDGEDGGLPIPELTEIISTNLHLARLTNERAQLVGLAVNSSNLDEDAATQAMAELEAIHKVPVVDPVRTGVAKLVDFMEKTI